MPQGVIFLTGAPLSSSLDWDSPCLLNDFLLPIASFSEKSSSTDKFSAPSLAFSGSEHASWRSLDLSRQHLTTGHSQVRDLMNELRGEASFLSTSDLSFSYNDASKGHISNSESQVWSTDSVDNARSEYYDHSRDVFDGVASSQIHAASNLRSFSTDASDFSTDSVSIMLPPLKPPAPASANLSDLEDIPNVALLPKYPQTMTVNLIVGIISITAPRAVKTRRGVEVDLVEILVGDETKSGFEITCWLPASLPQSGDYTAPNDLRAVLGGLRPQDIILLRNVALSSFRGKVHGQSLRKDMTKCHLLYRNRIDRSDIGGCYTATDLEDATHPQIAKTKRVREWVLMFVGGGTKVVRRTKGKIETLKEVLPPDTQ